MSPARRLRILYLEPFETGSHAAFTRSLTGGLAADWTVLTLPGRHWKWRMRGASAWLALEHPTELRGPFDVLVASAYLSLAELVGLAPALAAVPRLLYFHENQLAFPVRAEFACERDLHFGMTQLVSALAAERCAFNSAWNRDSFLGAARELLDRMPDAVPATWLERIAERSTVLPLPVELPDHPGAAGCEVPAGPERAAGPLLLWNHRWEHDKGPEAFFAVLQRLAEREVPFRVAICGERFREVPAVFEAARERLGTRLVQFGFEPDRRTYLDLLARAQLVVSTALHEFFGLAVLEAVHLGARPLVPDRLCYPELYPAEFRYADDATLADELERLCRGWTAGQLDLRADRRALTAPFAAPRVLPRYAALLEELAASGQ
jgi:glycosyltransferase involved in cell wall biosynthesis